MGTFEDTGEIRVLCVDDDVDSLIVMTEFLESEDSSITTESESNPLDALARLDTGWYDCVVSDYQMPEMDGVAFLKSVRERDGELPFVLFTGHGSEEVASDAISAGVTNYLRKESGTDQYRVLANQIRTAVERRRAIERFEGFLESAPDAIVIVDTDGAIELINSQAERLFGYDRSALRGEPIEVLLPERYREAHVGHRERYADDPDTRPMGADLDLYGLRRDGSEFPVDIALSPVHVGGDLEVMAAVRDISSRKWREEELRERERQLQRQNERLDEFTSMVSHDLRNPLNVAAGGVELAQQTGNLEHVELAEQALDRMQTLVEDLLTLAREGVTVETVHRVTLSQSVRTAWTTVETGAATLEVDLESDDVLLADQSRLRQILENLVLNAVEHGVSDQSGIDAFVEPDEPDEPPAAPTIRVGRIDDGFYVEDDGPGIPEEDRHRVFAYGYSRSEDGNGFGLAIVQRIVDAHGWEIDVIAGVDGGARFEVTGVEWVN